MTLSGFLPMGPNTDGESGRHRMLHFTAMKPLSNGIRHKNASYHRYFRLGVVWGLKVPQPGTVRHILGLMMQRRNANLTSKRSSRRSQAAEISLKLLRVRIPMKLESQSIGAKSRNPTGLE